MVTGPIFRVEMVSSARRRRYFFLRSVFGLLILWVLWSSYQGASYAMSSGGRRSLSISEQAAVATTFFVSFTWMQVLGILAVAPAMAVGTIATERERRTIEYLFATDLSNLEIVLGKTLARLLLVGQLVLASLPILFLFRLLGGIPADLLVASFLMAGSTAVFLTALSVCVSVWSKRSKDATIRVYVVLGALLLVPWIVLMTGRVYFSGEAWWSDFVAPLVEVLYKLNPVVLLFDQMVNTYAAGAGFDFAPVWEMVGWQLGFAAALLALATAAVRRVHLREASRGAPVKRRPLGQWLPRWRPAIGDHPMVWKEAFAGAAKTKLGIVGGLAMGALVLTACGMTVYAFLETLGRNYPTREYFQYVSVFTGFVGSCLLLLTAARSASLITVEKEKDTWMSLISTPLTGGEIIRGKLFGNLYSLRWGAFLLAFSWLLACVLDLRFAAIAAASGLTLTLLASFLSAVGLFFSLRSSTSLRAMGLTLLVAAVLGGLYLMCCCPIGVAMRLDRGPSDELVTGLGLAPCIPLLVSAPAVMFADNSPDEVVVAYVLGMIGYAIALGVVLNNITLRFDSQAGRTGDLPEASRRSAG
jgi:ABC-type transport system involved in multi-copper enzyme maturation permease subunit